MNKENPIVSNIKFYLSDKRCKPVKAHNTDVGYDLRAYDIIKGYQGTNLMTDDKLEYIKNRFKEYGYVTLGQNERLLIDSGIKLEYMPDNIELQIRPRSGMSLKRGLISYFGTIDPDYRGQLGLIVGNATTYPIRIERFERIAQLVPAWIVKHTFEFVDEKDNFETHRGNSGFGDSGTM